MSIDPAHKFIKNLNIKPLNQCTLTILKLGKKHAASREIKLFAYLGHIQSLFFLPKQRGKESKYRVFCFVFEGVK